MLRHAVVLDAVAYNGQQHKQALDLRRAMLCHAIARDAVAYNCQQHQRASNLLRAILRSAIVLNVVAHNGQKHQQALNQNAKRMGVRLASVPSFSVPSGPPRATTDQGSDWRNAARLGAEQFMTNFR